MHKLKVQDVIFMANLLDYIKICWRSVKTIVAVDVVYYTTRRTSSRVTQGEFVAALKSSAVFPDYTT